MSEPNQSGVEIMPLDATDVVAIQQLYAAYNVAADCGDGPAFPRCFASDGVLDAGGTRREGSDALAEFASGVPAMAPGIRHIATNVLVDGDGDSAIGQAYLMLLTTTSSPVVVAGSGRYEDRLVRSDGGWRFATRLYSPDRL